MQAYIRADCRCRSMPGTSSGASTTTSVTISGRHLVVARLMWKKLGRAFRCAGDVAA
jgi:hypothetical protein